MAGLVTHPLQQHYSLVAQPGFDEQSGPPFPRWCDWAGLVKLQRFDGQIFAFEDPAKAIDDPVKPGSGKYVVC
jgi:hypothetical protein